MLYKIRICEIDDELGLVFPEELAASLDLVEGDELEAKRTANGMNLFRSVTHLTVNNT